MKSLTSLLTSRKRSLYQKAKHRFLKTLSTGSFRNKSIREQKKAVDKLKSLERNLGIRPSLNLRHWALALAVGVVTVAGAQAQDQKQGPFKRKTDKKISQPPLQSAQNSENTLATTLTSWTVGPFLGDPLIGEPVNGDIDGDGDEDLIIGGYESANDFRVYLNDGNGNFTRGDDIIVGGVAAYYYGGQLADYDGDGDLDFVVTAYVYGGANEYSYFVPFLNNGSGQFTQGAALNTVDNINLTDFILFDIDLDGDLDILAEKFSPLYFSDSLFIYRNDGFGNFTGFTPQLDVPNFNFESNRFPFADFDGDGDIDYIANGQYNQLFSPYNSYPTIVIYQNDGNENFTGNNDSLVTVMLNFPFGFFQYADAIGDFDKDGDIDLIFSKEYYGPPRRDSIFIYNNSGSGYFDPSTLALATYNYSLDDRIDTLDADGDNDIDFVVSRRFGNDNDTASFFRNNVGSFLFEQSFSSLLDYSQLKPVNIDSDSDIDLLNYSSVELSTYKNDGLGAFTFFADFGLEPVYGFKSVPADFNGDGNIDIANSGTTQILLNQGGGNFAIGNDIWRTSGTSNSIDTLDVDSDGDIDIVFDGGYGALGLEVWTNDGSGNFSYDSQIPITNFRIYGFKTGDVDGDGDSDIAFVGDSLYTSNSYFGILQNNAGVFTPAYVNSFVYGFEDDVAELADIDGDGDIDLLSTASYTNYSQAIFKGVNDGSGNFTYSLNSGFKSTYDFESISIGDVDGDLDLDIVAGDDNVGYGYLVVFTNNGSGIFAQNESNALTGNPDDVDLFDVDGDSDLDIVVSSAYGNGTSIYLNDGLGVFTSDGFIEQRGYRLTHADFDNDGDLDIYTTEYNSASLIIFNEQFAPANNPPNIAPQSFTIAENPLQGAVVDTVVAFDPEMDPLTFSLTNNPFGAFSITDLNDTSAVLFVADSTAFDFEGTGGSIEATVGVSDGIESSTALVTVTISDVDESPVITPNQAFIVLDNAANSDIIDTVIANDPEGSPLTYSITDGDALGVFAINDGTGEISVNNVFLLDPVGTIYTLTIEVTDGTFTAQETVEIEVQSGNQPPVLADTTFSVDENALSLSAVDTLLATDPNGDVLTYTILSGNTNNVFELSPLTGVITVLTASELDFDITPVYNLQVRVSDPGNLADTATVTINVNEINTAPNITFGQVFELDENSANGSAVGTIDATDVDGDPISFGILSGNTGNTFLLDSATGDLSVGDSTLLDFETNNTFELSVVADDGSATDTASVFININNINEAPQITDQAFSVSENVPPTTFVGNVAAIDPDGTTPTWTILSGNDLGGFGIESNTGVLFVQDSTIFDFETNSAFSLTIEVADTALSDTGVITVDVLNVNEPVVAEDQVFSVDQNVSNGAIVDVVEASDTDGDPLTFTILSGNDGGAFALNETTGEITVADATQLDFDTTPDYNLVIEISDGELSLQINVQVKVTTLERDRLALLDISLSSSFEAPASWTGDPSNDWEGVTVEAGRVTELDLSNQGIDGFFPQSFADLTGLTSINLSGNNLTDLPRINQFPNLETLNVEGNKLQIAEIVKNLGITNYDYTPQQAVDPGVDPVIIEAGSDYTISVDVSGTGNEYTWSFEQAYEDILDSSFSTGLEASYTISGINYNSMGSYSASVSNHALDAGFSIEVLPQEVLAKTDVTGNVFKDESGTRLTGGQVDLLFTGSIPFDTAAIDNTLTNGTYELQDIILGDYILRVDPDDANDDVLITYYISQQDWVDADTLFLREAIDGIDITMIANPGGDIDPGNPDVAFAEGLVESDFADEEGRIEARRRVRKAGCSLRRRVTGGGGRIGQNVDDDGYQLVAYTETDENGEFSFSNIPAGDYRINIQYPGIPIDPNDNIEFTVDEDPRNGQGFSIAAEVTEEGISIEIDAILGTLKPYIKNAVLYPNPTDGELKLDYLVYRRMDELQLSLIDMMGKEVMIEAIPHQRGNQKVQLDISHLEPGNYILRLKNGDNEFNYTIRVTKQ